jgi:hypothetical protein
MQTEDRVALIRQARKLVISAMGGCEAPQVEAILRNADMELHWALWHLGEPVSLRPELDYGEGG